MSFSKCMLHKKVFIHIIWHIWNWVSCYDVCPRKEDAQASKLPVNCFIPGFLILLENHIQRKLRPRITTLFPSINLKWKSKWYDWIFDDVDLMYIYFVGSKAIMVFMILIFIFHFLRLFRILHSLDWDCFYFIQCWVQKYNLPWSNKPKCI